MMTIFAYSWSRSNCRAIDFGSSVVIRSSARLAHWPTSEPTPTLTGVLNLLDNFDHIEVEVKAVRDMALAEKLVQKLETELQGFEKS